MTSAEQALSVQLDKVATAWLVELLHLAQSPGSALWGNSGCCCTSSPLPALDFSLINITLNEMEGLATV